MRRTLFILAALAVSSLALQAQCVPSDQQSCTPGVGLTLPDAHALNWNLPLNQNFSEIDSLLSGSAVVPKLDLANLNNIVLVDGTKYACSDAGITAAMNALGGGGGIVDARGCTGNMTWTNTLTFSEPIKLLLGAVNITAMGNPGVTMNSIGAEIAGSGRNITIITSGINADLIQTAAGAEKVHDLELEGAGFSSNHAINMVGGNSQELYRIYANNFGASTITWAANVGNHSSISDSFLQPSCSASGFPTCTVPCIQVPTDTTLGHPRKVTQISCSGAPFDAGGGDNTLVTDSFFNGLLMNSSSKKFVFVGNRVVQTTNASITITGINQVLVGNAFAMVNGIILDSALAQSVIGPNIGVGGIINNAPLANANVVIQADNAGGFAMFPQMTAKSLLWSSTAPTISSGFGTSPSIVQQNGTAAFEINVGTGGASSGAVTLPTAANGWSCQVSDMTTNIASRETAFTTTSVTLTGASAWSASDKLLVNCTGF